MTHLLKIVLIWLALDGIIVMALEPEKIAEAKKLYMQNFSSGTRNYENVRNLSPAQRELMSAYFRSSMEGMERRAEEDAHFVRRENLLNLALLGDDSAREQVVMMFWKNSRSNAHLLEYLKDPKVISMIGDGLFMEEGWYGIGDVIYGPTQESIAQVVLDTLGNSPEFSADVINWARRVGRRYPMKMMRDWYRANEDMLKAGDFKAVQPGAEPPDRKASAPAGEAQSSLPPGSKPATAPVSRPGSVQSPESSGNVYAWIAALLLAVCGGLAWLLKRKRI